MPTGLAELKRSSLLRPRRDDPKREYWANLPYRYDDWSNFWRLCKLSSSYYSRFRRLLRPGCLRCSIVFSGAETIPSCQDVYCHKR